MTKNILISSLALIILISCSTKKTEQKPIEQSKPSTSTTIDTTGEADPIANSLATRGGTFTTWGSSFPKSLNMWLDFNSFSKEVTDLMFESLVTLHSTKNEPVGILAQSWTVSDDKKTITFTIHPDAFWSDGKPVTAEDVQFYYDCMMDPKNLTSVFRVDLKRFERPEVIDAKTLKLVAKEIHWSNFWTAAGMYALPKHLWNNVDFNKQNFEFPVVSGPYQLKEVKKNRYIILERRNTWWGDSKQYNQYKYNFNFIKYKFMEDRTKALEAFKNGIFDAYAVYTSSIWMKQTDFDAVQNGWVAKQQIYNKEPKGFQGLAMNLRRPIFQDVQVREALCLLLNRELMNEKLMYNQYFLLNSYYPDLYPKNVNPGAPVRKYDPDKARALLAKAGWKVGTDGLLRKNDTLFSFSFLDYGTDPRHLNIYIEDLKKVGITATIEQLSLSSFRKRVDNHDFDMMWMSWGASRLRDPEASWHSSTADQIATNNVPGVKDPLIDSLIDAQKTEMNLDRRNDILKRIDDQLNRIIPYVLLWQSDHARLLYWNRFGTPANVLDKFNREDIIPTYWWLDPKKDAALNDAKQNGTKLQPILGDVYYQE